MLFYKLISSPFSTPHLSLSVNAKGFANVWLPQIRLRIFTESRERVLSNCVLRKVDLKL